MKRCAGCGEEKPISRKTKRCKDCSKEYWAAHWERVKLELAGELPEKTCWRCRRLLPIEEFAWKPDAKRGRIAQCNSCLDPNGVKRCARCCEFKPKTEFYAKAGFLNSYCKPCNKKNGRENTLRKYGLTPAEYESLAKEQEGCCAICGKWTEVLWVDHDHSCCPDHESCGGCRRGLLCMFCNGALGMFQDDVKILRSAIAYLEFYQRGDEAFAGSLANLGVLRP